MKRFILGIVAVGLFAVLAVGLAVFLFARQAASRIVISPLAVSVAAHEAVLLTLANGTSEQKVQTMIALQEIGPGAMPFVPTLRKLTLDKDSEVCRTAMESIEIIDPAAAGSKNGGQVP